MPRLPCFSARVLALLIGAAPLASQTGSDGATPPASAPFTLARFEPHPGQGDAPLTVRFQDRSLGGVTSWRWDFGDGTSSTLPSPAHLYSEGGVYDVSLTVRGPLGTDTVTRHGAVTVRRCVPGSARANRSFPLERGEDFVPVTGDDAAGFYCVYSGKAVGPDNPGISNNVGIFVLPLVGDEVLLFGAGYGDENSFVTPTESAGHDARRVDALLRFCLGRTPQTTPIRFFAPHGHIDHINADFLREMRGRGYPIVDIAFHVADATWVRSLPGWTQADRALFRTLRSPTGQCQGELASLASPLGRIWFHLREGHTDGSIDLVLDVGGDPENRFIVRGSGSDFGSCPIPGVREAIEPHGNIQFLAAPPQVTGISPPNASALGGSLVTLAGSGFAASRAGAPMVLVDGVLAGSVTVLADDLLTCVVPAGIPADMVDVTVTNRSGRAVVNDGLRYRDLPTLTSLAPARGLASGGPRVTLTGTGFQSFSPGVNTVTFGGLPATAVQVIDDRTLTCTAPAHAPGMVDVRLANENGSAELPGAFRYDPLIDVTGVTPAQGSARGGTRVQVQGTSFAVGARVPDVFFGAEQATDVVRVSNTRLDCTTPAGPGATQVEVRVSGDNGSDALPVGFRYYAEPALGAVTPSSGPAGGGEVVTLTGTSFTKNSPGANQVSFGGRPALDVVTLSDTSIRCRAPAGTSGQRVDVVVDNGNGSGRLALGYRYHRVPTLASLSPAQGGRDGGTLVTLHGTGFLESGAGTTTVRFGAVAASVVSVVDDATLTCQAPAHASEGSVDVEVLNANGSARLANAFDYVLRPRLTGAAPAGGPARGGTLVTLSGAGFLGAGAQGTEVFFGRARAERVRVLDDGTVTCLSPIGLPGSRVDLRLVNQNGTARLEEGFAFLPLPGVRSVSPPSGPIAGGTLVRLQGRGFAGAATLPRVFFGSAPAAAVTRLGDEVLECLTPPGVRGLTDVRVETEGGGAVLPDCFVYGPTRPMLTGLAPNHGPGAGGNQVELTGSNFVSLKAGTNTVRFGGVLATGVTVLGDERLRCMPPAGTPGASVDVRIENGNGTVARAAAYRYHLRPTLTALEPAFGSPEGGGLVTLHGSGFLADEASGHAVRFGGTLATGAQVLDDTRLLCRTPAGAPGALVEVTLATSNGSAALAGSFRYQAAPELSGLAPAAGSPLGGTLVTLTGTGFALEGVGMTTVRFGSASASAVTILGGTQLTCLAPAGPAGATVAVRLENANGSASLPAAFRYHAAPLIASASPASGPAAGGTIVTLLGSGFRNEVLGANSVTFGGRPARSVTTIDDTRVRAVAPTGTPGTTVDLVLANSNGSALAAGGYRYHAVPVLGACEPGRASALGGATITLRGSGFQRDGAGPPAVLFSAVPAGMVTVLDDQTLTCLAPSGAEGSSVQVSLTNRNGAAQASEPFAYNPAPRLDGLTPVHGFSGSGTLVELRGTGFLANEAGANAVWFGASAATEVTVTSDTQLACRTPAGTVGPLEVRIDNANGSTALADGFFYDWAPTLVSLAPAQGTPLGGTLVTLTGGGFASAGAGALSVSFGATVATDLRVLDGQRLECTTPPGAAGALVSVTVSNSRGSSSLNGFRYHPRPTLASIDPPSGPPEGGTTVTLAGSGFLANGAGTPQVRFGGPAATGITVVDDATVRCVAPSGTARTSASVTLTNANGSVTLADAYRWLVREPTDLDADGTSDALVSAANGVYVYFGSASGPTNGSTATADLVLRPAVAGTDFGLQVAAGDLNGDKFPDLAVAAPLEDGGGTDAGAVYVFFGPLGPSPIARLSSTANALFRGASSGDRFGSALAVGDVSGSAVADLVVGAPFSDVTGSDGGAAYVYRGSPTFTGQATSQASARLSGRNSQDEFGTALSTVDVTGDGRADVIVGSPAEDGGRGAAYVFRGADALASSSASSAQVQIEGDDSDDRFGTSVAAADFDGDGIADLIVGAPEARNFGVEGGSVFAFRGGAGLDSGSAASAQARYDGEANGDRLGDSLALGDVDGDGTAELLVGAPQHDVPASNSGRAYLVRGGSFLSGSIETMAHMLILSETSAGDQFGASLGLVDLDGDGRAELLVGAPFSNGGGSDSGRVHVFLGSALQATRSAGADDATFTGASASLLLGREVGSTH